MYKGHTLSQSGSPPDAQLRNLRSRYDDWPAHLDACDARAIPAAHMHERVPLSISLNIGLMEDGSQFRNATLVAACAVLITAASYWTGRSAVLLAGALCARRPPYVHPTPSDA